MKEYLTHPVFKIISDIIEEDKLKAFVIGGFVRDLFLNRKSKDIDIVVVGSGIDLAKKVASKVDPDAHISVFKAFGTAMLKINKFEIEFVGARKESYRQNSRKPIVENGSLEDDQNRRDFTINALALSLNKNSYGKLSDPFNGLNDLKNKIIRTPLEPSRTFSDDPLRMIRGIRFATQLGFTIVPEAIDAIRDNKDRIKIVSNERIVDELNKILLTDKPSVGLKLLEETGLLEIIFPELTAMNIVETINNQSHKNNFYHTLEVVDQICKNTDKLWLRWAALLHDIAKPATKRFIPEIGWTFHGHEFIGAKMIPGIFKRLKMPLNEKMHYVRKMVLLHLRPIILAEDIVSDSAVRRLLFDAGDDIEDLMTLAEADITSKNIKKVNKYLNNFKIVRQKLKDIEEKDAIRNFQPPVSGEIIMEVFELSPSREIGIIKDAIKDAILDGIVKNNFTEAYDYMLLKGKELGLEAKHDLRNTN